MPCDIFFRVLVLVCNVFEKACVSCRLNCTYVLYSNLVTNIVDLTIRKLNVSLLHCLLTFLAIDNSIEYR